MPEDARVPDHGAPRRRWRRWRSRCRSRCGRSTARSLEAGEHVVIFGAGPIGQAICLLARERDAPVLMIDPQRRPPGDSARAWAPRRCPGRDDVIEAAREWSGGEGAEVVFDATGAPDAIRAGFETAVVGRAADDGRACRTTTCRCACSAFVDKELDVLGVSCAQGGRVRGGRRVRGTQRRQAREPDHAGVPAGAGARGAPVGDGSPSRGDEGCDRRDQLRRRSVWTRPRCSRSAARPAKALDAICDTFVPGEDGLPSATELGVPEAMLMAVGSSPSAAEQEQFAGLLDAWDTARTRGLLVALPGRARGASCCRGPTRPRSGSAPPSRRCARASC